MRLETINRAATLLTTPTICSGIIALGAVLCLLSDGDPVFASIGVNLLWLARITCIVFTLFAVALLCLTHGSVRLTLRQHVIEALTRGPGGALDVADRIEEIHGYRPHHQMISPVLRQLVREDLATLQEQPTSPSSSRRGRPRFIYTLA